MFAPDCSYCALHHNNVKPESIVAYVEANGWTRENQENSSTLGVKVKYYTKLVVDRKVNWRYVGELGDGKEVFIVKILLDNKYRDYNNILIETILYLAFAENRPCYKIIEDITKFDSGNTFSCGEGI